MDTGFFPGVKRPGYVVGHQPLFRTEVKESGKLPIWALKAYSRVNFPFLPLLSSTSVLNWFIGVVKRNTDD
jgi:hypothetical protein